MKTTINNASMWKVDHGPYMDYELSEIFSQLDQYFFDLESLEYEVIVS